MPKIDELFKQLMEKGGSDLHLEQGQRPKIRLHGELQDLGDDQSLSEEALVALLKEITSQAAWDQFIDSGDLDFAYALGEEARFRGNFFRHFYGYGAVFRVIPSKIQTLDELGLPAVMKNFVHLRSGYHSLLFDGRACFGLQSSLQPLSQKSSHGLRLSCYSDQSGCRLSSSRTL